MAEVIGTGIDEEELLRRQREEEERARKQAEEQAAQDQKAAEEAQAKAEAESQKSAQAAQEGAKVSLGPTNRAFTEEQSFLLHQRKAVRETETSVVKAGELDLPENLEPMRETLEEKNRKGELLPTALRDWGTNKIQIDFSSIKDIDQAAYFATTLDTEEDAKRFFKEYASKTGQSYEDVLAYADDKLGTKIFASPQSNAGKRNALTSALNNIGLFDINGDDIDIGTADFDTIVQSLTNIADEDVAKKAASYVESLTKIPGSPYYGMTFDKSAVEYRDSANLPEKVFKAEVDALSGMFYTGEGSAQTNQEAYLAKYEELMELYGEDKYAFRQVERALKNAYEKQTGYVAPDSAKVQEVIKQIQGERALRSAAEAEEANKDFLARVGNFFKGLFSDEKKEEEEEPVPVGPAMEEGEDYSMRDGYVASASASPTMPPQTASTESEGQPAEVQGPVYQPQEAAEVQGPAYQPQETSVENQPLMSYMDAIRAYSAGLDLSEENMAVIADSIGNDDFRNYVLNNAHHGAQAIMNERAYGGTMLTDAQARIRANAITSGRQLLGTTLGGAVEALETGALSQDVTGAGYQLMADVMNDVSRYIRSGRIAVPAGENKYDYVINNVPHIKQKADQLAGLQKEVNAITTTRAMEAAQEYDKKVEAAEQRFLRGHATPEDLMLLSQNVDPDSVDLNADQTRMQFRAQLSHRSMWYDDDGAFWNGGSAAADEGLRLRQTHADGLYGDYKRALLDKAHDVIDELTYIAADHNMTLGAWMEKVGLPANDPGAIMDMAYNRMCAEGAKLEKDPEAQEAVNTLAGVETKSVGWLGASVLGLGHGLADDTYHFMNAGYLAYDAATYDMRRNEVIREWDGKYGALGPKMYRGALTAYANSGELSKEQSQELLEDIARCTNIYDIPVDFDPGLIEGLYLDTMDGLSKAMEELESVRELLPESEARFWDALYGVGTNVPGMIRSAATTIGAAAVGVPLPVAKAAGLWMGYGATTFSRGTKKYEDAGMTRSAAMAMGMLEAGAMMAVNLVGQDTATSYLTGKALTREGIETAFRDERWFGVAKAIAKKAAPLVAEEALEEGEERLAEEAVSLAAPVVEALDRGEQMTLSKGMQMTWAAYKDIDVKNVMGEVMASGLGGAAYGALFAFPKLATTTMRSRANAKTQALYPSVDIASQIVHGEIEASDENMGRFIDLMREDLEKPEFRVLLDKRNDSAEQANSMAVAALLGEGKEYKDKALKLTQTANQYDQKAEAAEKSVEINRSQFYTARKLAAEGNEGAAKALEGFRTAWAKAQTTATENRQAAQKKREEAAEQTGRWIYACRKLGDNMYKVSRTNAGTLLLGKAEEAKADETEKMLAEEEANIDTLGAEAFIEKNYPNASDEQKDHIREIYGVPVGTKKETAAAQAADAVVQSAGEQTVTEAEPTAVAETVTETVTETAQSAPVAQGAAPAQAAETPVQTVTAPQAEAPTMQTQTSTQRTAANLKRQLDNATKFAGQVTRRFGVATEIVSPDHEKLRLKSGRSAAAAYDRETDTIYVSANATQGDVFRAKVMHELAHRTEGTQAYNEFAKAVKAAYFKGSKENEDSYRRNIKRLYTSNGVKLSEDGLEHEVVSRITEEIIGGNEEIVNRLVADSPSVARKIMDAIKEVLSKLTGVKGKEVDQMREVEKMFQKALDEAVAKQKANASLQHSLEAEPNTFSTETGEPLTGTVKGDTVVQYSLGSWTPEEQQTVRTNLIGKGYDEDAVDNWIDDVNSVAAIVAADRDRLDFEAADNQVMLKPNQEYVRTLDASTLCAKRLLYQGTFNAIQHRLPNKVMTSDDLIRLRNMMAEAGYETPCGICYVESRRRNLGTFAKKWLNGYDAKGGYQPKLDDVTTTDGLERMRREHPEVYDSFVAEMKRKGSNNPKVVQLRTDYRGDIRKLSDNDIDKIVKIGGLRVQSFSDFETPHLLDMMQAVLDMTEKDLTSQAYTKVPNFAWVFGDTGIKINLSLIADGNGLDENGQLLFSSYEGMDFEEAMRLRDRYGKNVGTILVGLNDAHIKAALADNRIDFIIPFHKSGWGKRQLAQLSGMSGYMDYTRDQNERRVVGTTKTGKPKTKNVAENFHPVGPDGYWNFGKSGDENAATYLRMCEEDGRIPKFNRFLTKDADGHYVAPSGYWKLLIDFKMYDNDGVGAPQMPVRPNFNMTEATRVLGEYEGGADTLPVARDIVERFVSQPSGESDMQYSIDVPVDQRDQAYFDNIGQHDDIVVTSAPASTAPKLPNGNLDKTAIMNAIRSNPLVRTVSGRSVVECPDIEASVEVNTKGVTHAYATKLSTNVQAKVTQSDLRNAKASMLVPDLLQNAVEVNRSAKYSNNKGRDYGHVLMAVYSEPSANGQKDYYAVRMVVEHNSDKKSYDLVDLGVVGRLHAANAKKIPSTNGRVTVQSTGSLRGRAVSVYKVSDLIKDVKSDFDDTFSNGVYQRAGVQRKQNDFSKHLIYSIDEQPVLPDDDFLRAEIDAWKRDASFSVDNSPAEADTGDRQFATQTIQQNEYVPDWIKQEFLNDPTKREYSRESNMARLERAWGRIRREGYDAVRDRLVNQETKYDPEDNADALVMMRTALHENDMDTFMAIATKYNTEGTDQAKALQIRSMMRKMTPTGFSQKVIQNSNRKLQERMKKRPLEHRRIEKESGEIIQKRRLKEKDSTSTADKLARGESIRIDNKFGAPLNDVKRELIKEFGLEKTARPGVFYNWATTKQRMLEDILTTDDVWAKDSNGMNLVDRLSHMKHGYSVITKADVAYITEQMGVFERQSDKNSREADVALSRAYEAEGNILEATGREKRRTWRYTSMLLSVASATRNVIGNIAQSIPNAVAGGIAVEMDRVISAVTGTERTRAHLSIGDRINGWNEFLKETKNTFRDYFVDKTITQHGEDRYNRSQRGRVYQTQAFETLRQMEGLLMSVGDRNFWKKKFFNSLAEQQHLAEINGTEFDIEAAMETAEAEANYATFNEDGTVRRLMSSLTQEIPFLDYLMPFVGVPTNIIKRQIEFSPIGFATTAFKHGMAALLGEEFDQRAFVDGMSRSLTGTGMMLAGMALASMGAIKLGAKEEDDDKSYGVRTAQGDQYGVYFTIGDKNYSITTFSPAASALVAGAFVMDALGDNQRWYQALWNGMTKNVNEIFDASYMSALGDALNTSNGKTFVENLGPAIGSAVISQNIPAPISHWASSMDEYVRDTKDKDALMEIVKTTMNKIPGARELLPEKVDVAGRTVMNTKQGLAAFVDPFTTSYVTGDPALDEMIRLRDALTEAGDSEPRAHMATDALSGRKNTLTQNKVSYTVTAEEKEAYRKRYGDLWRNGGVTYDKTGRKVPVQGVEELISSRYYQLLSEKEKAKAIREIVTAAKTGATYEIMNHK